MNIVILGAGQVGATLAKSLASENNNVTVVDHDGLKLAALRERLDVGIVEGHASHPDIMRAANCLDAEMVIAVTNNDETNMIACQVAYTVFGVPQKIARVRSESYKANKELFADEAIPIDEIIIPEHLVSDAVGHLIAHPGARQVVDFFGDNLNIVTLRVDKNAPMASANIKTFKKIFPESNTKILAIYRKNNRLSVKDTLNLKADDELVLAVISTLTPTVIKEFKCDIEPYKSIIIAGGGNIGFALAKDLENRFNIKVIDPGDKRVDYLSENLSKALVLHGDAADSELLIDENIAETDLYCAVTNNDGVNIMSCLLAKRLGAKKVIALITKGLYSELISGSEIDAAISPQNVTVSALLKLIRKGDVVQAHSIKEGALEAIELIVHGDEDTSEVVGRKISELNMPGETKLVAIERQNKIIMDFQDEAIEANDKVLMLALNRDKVKEIEQMFRVAATYI